MTSWTVDHLAPYDTDHNGALNIEEMKHLARDLGKLLRHAGRWIYRKGLDMGLAVCDGDASGTVTLDEGAKCLNNAFSNFNLLDKLENFFEATK